MTPASTRNSIFTPGDAQFNDGRSGFTPIQTSVGRLGLMVCWDQWYPEAARLMALAGAEMLIYPTAIGWDETDDRDEQMRQLEAWVTVQRGHAVANNLPVIAPNRIGVEPDPTGPAEASVSGATVSSAAPRANSWPVPTRTTKPSSMPRSTATARSGSAVSGPTSGTGVSMPMADLLKRVRD